jgi:hypothetical protein
VENPTKRSRLGSRDRFATARHDPHDADEPRTPLTHTAEKQVARAGTTIA